MTSDKVLSHSISNISTFNLQTILFGDENLSLFWIIKEYLVRCILLSVTVEAFLAICSSYITLWVRIYKLKVDCLSLYLLQKPFLCIIVYDHCQMILFFLTFIIIYVTIHNSKEVLVKSEVTTVLNMSGALATSGSINLHNA